MPVVAASYILAASLALGAAEIPSESRNADPSEVACLALNVYHEARGESAKGQAAVAHVTLNRVRSARYPDRVCEVVTQKWSGVCQFSWYCDRRSDQPLDMAAFDKSMRVALDVVSGRRADPTGGATYFIARSIAEPDWAQRLTRTVSIDGHHFYRR
ncbi:MAG: cell wall hydrolase [Rubrimonas sp.]|uniref:cell wall hydrolase n=1 Tax=Rubrimonas sp. TaxID=2036015 RepID=UPI002FDE81FE